MKKKALITGISGQDGSYLAEYLLSRNYEVHGCSREIMDQASTNFLNQVVYHKADITVEDVFNKVIDQVVPDEIYHLATGHEVGFTNIDFFKTQSIDVQSTFFILNAMKQKYPKTRLFYASSSRVFGQSKNYPQNEKTDFAPVSLYGISKLTSQNLIKLYREQFGLFACSGILYNHESPRRSEFFLPRKITATAARIKYGLESKLELGDISAQRDWGAAEDFVKAFWLMLQSNEPEDYVIGTGQLHSVQNILEIVFSHLQMNWSDYVVLNTQFQRPAENYKICADISKANSQLGWKPEISFENLIIQMLEADLVKAKSALRLKK